MARGFRMSGVGGGSNDPTKLYLYKNGQDNITLTGGISTTGWSGWAGFSTQDCTVSFTTTDISISPSQSASYPVAQLGTQIKVDVTDAQMVVYVIEYNGSDHEFTLDVSSVTGNRYIGIGYTMRNNLWISAGTGKSTESSPYKSTAIGNYNIKVKEIYLYIPSF